MGAVFRDITAEEAERFSSRHRTDNTSRVWLAEWVSRGTVLDIGCGRGLGVRRLFDRNRYVGLDISPELIRVARRDNPGYLFGAWDCSDLSCLEDGSFDFTIVRSVLEHCDHVEEALAIYREALRIARKRAYISWHTPPRNGAEELRLVQVEMASPVPQNRYRMGAFQVVGYEIKDKVRVEEAEIWVVERRESF